MKAGDKVVCEGWDPGSRTVHTILEVITGQRSQTGTMFRVRPALRLSAEGHWIDSGWFKPLPSA